MEDDQKIENLTPEEQIAEEEALKDIQDSDLRAKISDELGLAEDDELVDKLVEREKVKDSKLKAAIRQKINWRNKATTKAPGEPVKKEENKKTPTFSMEEFQKQQEALIAEQFERRDLEEMDFSDEVKAEIKILAKAKGVSVKKAAQDPYITYLVDKESADKKITESFNNGSGGNSRKVPSKIDMTKPLDANDFDLSTPEGRKAWDDAKAAKRKANGG